MRAVAPSVAVFSVQRDNRFSHPHPTVVERYKASGVNVFRTDAHGAITVRTDGQSMSVEPYVSEPAVLAAPATHHPAQTRTPLAAAPR